MKNHISFQFPRTFQRKKEKKLLRLYKYKKHLSAQETQLCHFPNDPYLCVQEKSDLMNYSGNHVPFCSTFEVAIHNSTWLAAWWAIIAQRSQQPAQCGPEAFMFPS